MAILHTNIQIVEKTEDAFARALLDEPCNRRGWRNPPNGLTDIPRTDVENEALRVIRLLSTTCKSIEKEKAGKSFDFPAVVDQTLKSSNLRFLEGLLEIQKLITELESLL